MKQKVLDFIRSPGDLEPIALELFRWQCEHSTTMRRFAGGLEPTTLEEIPAVPVSLMKQVSFSCVERPTVVYRTSGTTSGARGEHWMADNEAYALAVKTWFEAVVTAPLGCVSLITDAPDSSLGAMIKILRPRAVTCFPDVTQLPRYISLQPVFLTTTAFALADLLGVDMKLPTGSVVMVTGGFKGRQKRIERDELLYRVPREMGEVQVIEEYGMTELSSQLWDVDGLGFAAPPWLHAYTVDPVSGRPIDGMGLIRFVDLANWSSVLCIETEDLGIIEEGRVRLLGRLPSSLARGCSLSYEEAHV